MKTKMKSVLPYIAMAMAMGASSGTHSHSLEVDELTNEEKEQRRLLKEKKRIEMLKKRGVEDFWYNGNVVYARNQKNADRKARNKGYLIDNQNN